MAWSQYSLQTNEQNSLSVGEVVNGCEQKWCIVQEGTFTEANLAASCLVAPQKGSKVLVANIQDQAYILAVLTHPAKTLKIAAQEIELASQGLLIHNKTTQIKTNHLRFDVRRLVSLVKRAYAEFGQMWQKSQTMQVDTKHYQLQTEFFHEKTKGLSHTEAEVISDKAKVSAVKADKFLVN